MEKLSPEKFLKKDFVINSHAKMGSMLDYFYQADFFVQLIVILLGLMSIYSWAIIFQKITLFKKIKKEYDLLSNSLLNNNLQNIVQNRFAAVKNFKFLGEIIICVEDAIKTNEKISAKNIELKTQEILFQMEENLSILGSISSSSPFIGLLGTVWGIMGSLKSIGIMKSANIAVIAPGMAEALFATALGLLVAIPALIFSNNFYSKLEEFSIKLNGVMDRLINKE